MVAWDPQAVGTGVWSSIPLMTMLVPGIDSRDIVAGVAVELAATLENIFEVESYTIFWSRCTLPLSYNLSA